MTEKGTQEVARAYIDFLYTPAAQEIIAKNFYRPSIPKYADKEDLKKFMLGNEIYLKFFNVTDWTEIEFNNFIFPPSKLNLVES